jgi:hypothetical protein
MQDIRLPPRMLRSRTLPLGRGRAGLGSDDGVRTVLAELQRVVPLGVQLTGLRLESRAWAVPFTQACGEESCGQVRPKVTTEKDIRPICLLITGLSATDVDIANLIAEMATSPLFENVTVEYDKDRQFDGGYLRAFSVSCYVAW